MVNYNITPQIIGPGNWYSLHLMAAHAKTKTEKKAVLFLIKLFANNFYCGKCQKHFNEFLEKHPPKKYYKDDKLFHFTWLAHNYTNKLTGKNIISYEEARSIFFQ